MENTTIYKVTNGKVTYSFRTSIKNNHTIHLYYKDDEGEYSLNQYDLAEGAKEAMDNMREDFIEYIRMDNLCRARDRKYVQIDFEMVMRNFIGLNNLPDLHTVDTTKKHWLKVLLNS